MKQFHIAYVAFPHHPHVNPSLSFVSTLVRRGHRVTYATCDRYARRVEATGAEFVSCPDFTSDRTGFGEGEQADKTTIFANSMCKLAMRTLARLTSFYSADRPDVIIYDFVAFAGRILAEKWGIPAIQVSSHFAFDKLSINRQIRNATYRDLNLRLAKQADRFLEQHGIGDQEFIFRREKLNIYLFPRDFDPGDSEDQRCFYAGRCPGEQPYFGDWRKTDRRDEPIALIATSTTYVRGPDYFRMCMDALSGLHWHVILLIGDNADPSSFLPLPPNFEIVQRTSPTKILPHASLLVFGGGTITAAEAAYHGVPLVMTSCGFPELEGLADNFAELGVGLHLREADTSVESLRHAALHASGNATTLSKVAQLQHRVRRAPGAEETANRIEEYAENQL